MTATPKFPTRKKEAGGKKTANTAGTAKKRLSAQKKSMKNNAKGMEKMFS